MTEIDPDGSETAEVSRETLEKLRSFADAHAYEYGTLETLHAVIDAGIALGMDDPTPSYADPEDDGNVIMRTGSYDDGELAEYTCRYHEVKNND